MDHVELVQSSEISPAHQIQAVAEQYGIELTPDRFEGLVAKAERAADMRANNEKISFSQDGLMIAPPTEVPGSDKTISQMHYLPKTSAMPHGATLTQRKESISVIHRGLRGMQDYVLLGTADLIPTPDSFLGHTNNAEMAAMASRFGFVEHGDSGDVTATFETVRDHVMSPESVRLERALFTRSSAAAGNVALRHTVS